jgi:hypothetical protein
VKSEKYKPYKSIKTLPYWLFDRARDTGDLRYLLILDSYEDLDSIKGHDNGALLKIWGDLFDSYLDHFGISKDLQKIVQLKRDIAVLSAEAILYNQPYKMTFVFVKQKQLELLQKDNDSSKSLKFEEQVVSLERWLKIRIDEKTVTTVKFLTYLQQYNEEANRLKFEKLKNG